MWSTVKNFSRYTHPLASGYFPYFYIVLFYTCLCVLPKQFHAPFSLDPQHSALLASHEALFQQLDFGVSHISIFGPLAFLKARLTSYYGVFPLLLIDFITVCIASYLTINALRRVQQPAHLLLGLLPCTFISLFYDLAYLYYIFFIFSLLLGLTTRRIVPWLLALWLTCVVVFIQIQPGLVMLLLFLVGLLLRFSLPKALVGIALLAVMLGGGSYFLHVHLWKYLSNGFLLLLHQRQAFAQVDYIGGYQQFIPFILGCAFVFVLLVASYCILHFKVLLATKKGIFFLCLLVITCCMLYTQTFTHLTPSSIVYLFFYGLLALMICSLFIQPHQGKSYFQRIVAVLSFLSILFSTAIGFSPNPVTLPYQDLVFESPAIRDLRRSELQAQIPIDSNTIASLQGITIDVYPNEVAYLYYSYLSYRPRPVSQSRYSYLPALASLNQDFYASDQAPEYVLMNLPRDSVASVFTDATTFLSILQHYEPVEQRNSSTVLLHRRPEPLSLDYTSASQSPLQAQTPTATVTLQAPALLSMQVRYTWLGWIYEKLYQPPLLHCRISKQLPHGQITEKQSTFPLLQVSNGLFITPFSNSDELQQFLKKPEENASYTIDFSLDDWFFQKNFQITFQTITLR